MARYLEPGNLLPVVSLGGVISNPGLGRVVDVNNITLNGTAFVLSVSNPKRISAIVQNIDDAAHPGAHALIYLGGLNSIPIDLTPYGTLQIDKDFPWIGEIDGATGTGGTTPVITIVEIGLQ